MARIIFPQTTSPGERPGEGGGRLINCYAEPRPTGKLLSRDADYILKRAPGANVFSTIAGKEGYRGGILVGSTFYAAFKDIAVAIDSDGTATDIDELTGEEQVFWASNNNATPQIVAVTGSNAYVVTSSSVDDYSDSDVGSPNAVTFLDGYFFFTYGNAKCQASGINTTDIDTNDSATAESRPDSLLRPVRWNGQLLLCGAQTIEVWAGNPVNDTGFPFNRVTVISRGLIGAGAIAGFEDGFGDALCFVGDDNRVYQLINYQPTAVSPPDLDRLIERVSDKTTLEATVYKAGGQSFWQLSCADWTWVYNVNLQRWHERESYLSNRSRLTQAAYAFGKWICGDTDSGNLLQITNATARESGDPLVVRAESYPIEKFPNRIRVPRADFEFATGVGSAVGTDPIETDPVVSVSWSDDGGLNWSVPLLRKIGRQAKAGQTVTLIGTGQSGPIGRKWRVEMADPVHFGLMGGEQSTVLGAK